MSQLTIRGFEPELEEYIHNLAKKEKQSLNQTVIKLLRKATGIGASTPKPCISDSLDEFIGTWSANDKKSFDKSLSFFEHIDNDMWK